MEFKKSTYKKQYKKADTPKTKYGSGFTVQGSWTSQAEEPSEWLKGGYRRLLKRDKRLSKFYLL